MSEGVFDPNVTMNDVIKMVSPENVKLDNQNVKEVIHEITKEVENTIQSKGELDENKGYFIFFIKITYNVANQICRTPFCLFVYAPNIFSYYSERDKHHTLEK